MTTLVSWIGVDHRGPASVYIASDSRLSLGRNSWDRGRKVFSSRTAPHIFGYCGDVLFPSMVLGQIISEIDYAGVLGKIPHPIDQHKWFIQKLSKLHESYIPSIKEPFWIIHAIRHNSGMNSIFSVWKTAWLKDGKVDDTLIKIPLESEPIVSLGSGRGAFLNWDSKFKRKEYGGTSRAVFQAHCLSIASGEDPKTGGPAQLVGLHRIHNGRDFYIRQNGQTWLNGIPVDEISTANSLECFNELFERCDPRSGNRLVGAQVQPLPFRHTN